MLAAGPQQPAQVVVGAGHVQRLAVEIAPPVAAHVAMREEEYVAAVPVLRHAKTLAKDNMMCLGVVGQIEDPDSHPLPGRVVELRIRQRRILGGAPALPCQDLICPIIGQIETDLGAERRQRLARVGGAAPPVALQGEPLQRARAMRRRGVRKRRVSQAPKARRNCGQP